MESKDRERFFKMLAVFAEIHNRPISDGSIETYFKILSPWNIEDVLRAGNDILKHSQFFPKPADFIQRLETEKQLSEDERAIMAWTTLMRERDCGDQYDSVEFEDGAMGRAVFDLFGGWTGMFDVKYDELKFLKKDFLSLYKIHARRIDLKPIHLPGIFEKDGAAHNVHTIKAISDGGPTPKLISDGIKDPEEKE